MQPEETRRLERLIRVSLFANGVGLLVNAAMFYALLVFVVNEPADIEGVSGIIAPASASDDAKVKDELRSFYARTSSVLDRAARRAGTNPADVMPTNEQMDAAVESRTTYSPESEVVLQKLREGYDYYNLDWPSVMPD